MRRDLNNRIGRRDPGAVGQVSPETVGPAGRATLYDATFLLGARLFYEERPDRGPPIAYIEYRCVICALRGAVGTPGVERRAPVDRARVGKKNTNHETRRNTAVETLLTRAAGGSV